ncbi:hypothetical protein [Escherichia coli]|uniref:hypothetical protein n=1 Tax=Escherichia coli TaxID=562 RepID=UPI003F4FB0DA
MALLLSSQALAQAHKTLTESSTGIIWIDNGTQSLESASVIDRNGNANDGGSVTGKNFAVGSDAKIWDADKSMAVGKKDRWTTPLQMLYGCRGMPCVVR